MSINAVVSGMMVTLLLCCALLADDPVPVGRWDFDNASNLTAATVGNSLTLIGSDQAVAGYNAPDGAARIGVGSRYSCVHGISANGGGAKVNEYTIVFDLTYPVSSAGHWKSLYQADASNSSDADLFIRDATGAIGVSALGGYSANVTSPGNWYRIAFTVDNGTDRRVYVNGSLWLDGNAGSVDDRHALDPTVLFFADENGEDYPVDISRILLYDRALTAPEVAALGAPEGGATPPLTFPYLQDVRTNRIEIMWEMALTAAGHVEYGLTPSYGSTATCASVTSGGNTQIYKSYIMELAADTLYYYRVTSGGWTSDGSTFTTAPMGTPDFSFAVWGDSQGGTHDPTFSLMSHMAAADPDIAVSVGDMAEHGDNYAEVCQYFLRRVTDNLGPASVPYYVAWGNHDQYGNQLIKDFAGHRTAGNYAFYYAGCYFLCIDDEDRTDYTWMETSLQSAVSNNARHIFVFVHRPPYCERWIDGDSALRANLVPLMEQYGVDVCFSGHMHAYEYGMQNGVRYCITGGGSWLDTGEPLVKDWAHMTVGGYHDLAPGVDGGLVNEYVWMDVTDSGWTATMVAFNSDGSRRSEVTHTFSSSVELPAAPTGLVATAVSSTQIDLIWTDVATNELYYKAYRSPDGTTGWGRIDPDGGLPPDTESFGDTNCTPETTYYYAVRCINAAGNSDYSSTESATTPTAGPPTNLTSFTAYNDLAWSTGQTTDKITTYTTSNTVGGVRTGYLKDYVSGVTIDVRLTVSGGDGVQALQGYHPGAGTDAHTVFDGKVDCASTISYSEPSDLELEFSELSIAGTYEVVIYPDRGGDYANRLHHATIGSADSFVNESTAGVTITTVSTLNDTTIFNAGTNTSNGYVTRFTGVEPGSDGTFTVTLRQNYTTADYYSYANAVMLKSPSGDGGPGLTEKIAKGATWRYAKGTAEPSSPPTAWRSVAFDDSGWALGPTPLGYKTSVGGLATSLGDMYDGYPTVYMRNTFDVPNPAVVNQMTVQVDYDDGFILFINGQEMARVNVAGAAGTFMAHTHVALSSGSTSAWSDTWDKARLPVLRPGQNVATLQVFNGALTSSDLYMDLVLALAEGSTLDPADDADADGMDDGWETANCAGGDGTATNDVDGDRVSDAGEFVAGTLPTDPASVFSLREEKTGDGLLLSFDVLQATAGYYDGLSRHYALEECLDLEGGAWSPVSGHSNITAISDATITYTNSSDDGLILYRGRVWLESQ